MSKFWCRHKFSFLLGIYLEVDFWDHTGILYLVTTLESDFVFQSNSTIVHFHQLPQILNTCCLMGVKCHLIV